MLVAACNSGFSNPIVEAAVDSAGSVPIDTMSAAALDAVPRLQAEPYIEIAGDASDETRFSEWIGVEYSANGEVYVVDRLAHNVRVYDTTGNLRRHFGRRGGGPGEMNYPDHVLLKNDTLLVMDRVAIHRFRPDGTYITRATYQMNFHDPKWGDVGIAPQTFDIIPQGLVTSANLHVMMQQSKEPKPDTTSLFFMSITDGSIQKPFLQIGSNNFYAFIESGHRVALFAPESEFAVTSDGRVLVNARDGVAVDEYRDGVKTRRLLLSAKQRSVTQADVDSLIERQRIRTEEWTARADVSASKGFVKRATQGLRRLARERYFSTTGKLIAGDDGSVLMLRPDLSPGSVEWNIVSGKTTWDVISRDLKIIGRVELPDGFLPMIMRGEVVVGKRIDENDVPSVIGYRLSHTK